MEQAYGRPPEVWKLLGHEVRWGVLRALEETDLRVSELVALLGAPINLVSYHLRKLRESGLVSERRSSADGRDSYYRLEIERLQRLYMEAGADLHPALAPGHGAAADAVAIPKLRVAFVCTHNSARSQLAEAIARHLGAGAIEAWSAGVTPSSLHPLTSSTLAELRIDAGGLRSKPLTALEGLTFDYVITVCDSSREACPSLAGEPTQLHWSFPDPAAEPEERQAAAFCATAQQLMTRIRFLLMTAQRAQGGGR